MKRNNREARKNKVNSDNNRRLYEYVRAGNVGEISKLLVSKAVDVNTIPPTETQTVLTLAAQAGHAEIVQMLLGAGAEINLSDKTGAGALHLAAFYGRLEVVQILLARGAEINLINKGKEDAVALHAAASSGQLEVVKLLLKSGSRLNSRTTTGWTPLHFAALQGREEVVKVLLEHEDAMVDVRTAQGWTPLLLAAQSGCAKITSMLLQKRADVNLSNEEGAAALDIAVQNGHLEVVKILCEQGGADVNKVTGAAGWTPLRLAISKGDETITSYLLTRNPNLDLKGADGATVLHLAAAGGNGEIVQALLNNGADMAAQMKEGETPLHMAVQHNRIISIHPLLSKGADVNAMTHAGNTPLHIAVLNNNAFLVKVLLQRNANMVLKNKRGQTALYIAHINQQSQIHNLLKENAANVVNEKNKEGYTLLHLAAANGEAQTCEEFLDLGADIKSLAEDGLTPLHVAALSGHKGVASVLCKRGADVNVRDNIGMTPLHQAAQKGYGEIAGLLLDEGANIELVTDDGATALHLAAGNGHENTVELLLDKGADVNTNIDRGQWRGLTPLYFAVQGGHVKVIHVLAKKAGFDANARGMDNLTALHLAAQEGKVEVVRLLLEYGAEINSVTQKDAATALHYAALNGHAKVVELLLARGGDANKPMADGRMALHIAAQKGHVEVMKMLLQKGANINHTTIAVENMTPLHFAIQFEQIEMVSFLLQQSADVHLTDLLGRTPLTLAKDNSELFQNVIMYPTQSQLDLIKIALGDCPQPDPQQQILRENGEVILHFSSERDAKNFFEALCICYSGQSVLSKQSITLNVFALKSCLIDAAAAKTHVAEVKKGCKEVADIFKITCRINTYSVSPDYVSYSGETKEKLQKLSGLVFFKTYSLKLNLDTLCIDVPKSIFLDKKTLDSFKKDLEEELKAMVSMESSSQNGNKESKQEEMHKKRAMELAREEEKKAAEIASRPKTEAERLAAKQRKIDALAREKEEAVALERARADLAREEKASKRATTFPYENKGRIVLAGEPARQAVTTLADTPGKTAVEASVSAVENTGTLIQVFPKEESLILAKAKRGKHDIKKKKQGGMEKAAGLQLPSIKVQRIDNKLKSGLSNASIYIDRLMKEEGETILEYKLCLLSDLGSREVLQEKTFYLSENPRECQFRGKKGAIYSITLPGELDLTDLSSKLNNATFKWQLSEFVLQAGYPLGFWDAAMQRHILHGIIYALSIISSIDNCQEFADIRQQLVEIRNQLAHECRDFDAQGRPTFLVLYSKAQLMAMGRAITALRESADVPHLSVGAKELIKVFRENEGTIIQEEVEASHQRRIRINSWRLKENWAISNQQPVDSNRLRDSGMVMLCCKIGEAYSKVAASSRVFEPCRKIRNKEYHDVVDSHSSQEAIIRQYEASEPSDVLNAAQELLLKLKFPQVKARKIEVPKSTTDFFRASSSASAEPNSTEVRPGPS